MVERTTNNFRFPGQYFIEETGLYYNWWRWYKMEIGRYVLFDMILKDRKITNGFNKYCEILSNGYQYANLNPSIYTDFNGLKSKEMKCECPGEDKVLFNCTKIMKDYGHYCRCRCFCYDLKGRDREIEGDCDYVCDVPVS